MGKPKGLVLVVWDDAAAGTESGLGRRRTVGWVSKRTRRSLVLRQTKDDTGEVMTTWTIPRCQIRKVRRL